MEFISLLWSAVHPNVDVHLDSCRNAKKAFIIPQYSRYLSRNVIFIRDSYAVGF